MVRTTLLCVCIVSNSLMSASISMISVNLGNGIVRDCFFIFPNIFSKEVRSVILNILKQLQSDSCGWLSVNINAKYEEAVPGGKKLRTFSRRSFL